VCGWVVWVVGCVFVWGGWGEGEREGGREIEESE